MIRMGKLYLTYFQSLLILLTILMKNHGILEILTTIQFHHKTLNLTNTNHWRIGKFLFQWDWTWRRMWHRFSILWFSFTFWIYVDSGILTRFGPKSRVLGHIYCIIVTTFLHLFSNNSYNSLVLVSKFIQDMVEIR